MLEPPFPYRVAQPLHQPLVEPQIVLGHQHRAQYLARADEMVEIGALELVQAGHGQSGLERLLVLGEARVADVDRPVAR